MAFKKSKQKFQPDLFATASFSLPERERRYMEDELSWHNEFYRNVLLNIDEEILRPLFVDGNIEHWDRFLYRIRLWDKSCGRAERIQ